MQAIITQSLYHHGNSIAYIDFFTNLKFVQNLKVYYCFLLTDIPKGRNASSRNLVFIIHF